MLLKVLLNNLVCLAQTLIQTPRMHIYPYTPTPPTHRHTHTRVVWLGIHPVCVQKVPKRGLHLTSNRAPFIMSRTRAPLPSNPLHHHPRLKHGDLAMPLCAQRLGFCANANSWEGGNPGPNQQLITNNMSTNQELCASFLKNNSHNRVQFWGE